MMLRALFWLWKSPLRGPASARFALALLIALTSLPCPGAPREFLLQRWTRDEGLPASTVAAVAQTPEGYLWIGTSGGLARFDGVRFTRVDLKKLAGVQAQRISSLSVSRDGALWISSDDGLLVRFSQGRFSTYLPPSKGSPDRPIRKLVESGNEIWALNYEGIIARLAEGNFREVSQPFKLTSLAVDPSGQIWVGAEDRLLRWSSTHLEPVVERTPEQPFQAQALKGAKAGGCWVVGDGMVRRFEGGLPVETRVMPKQVSAPVSDIVEDADGNLWLATYGDGIVILGPDKTTHVLSRAQGLPSGVVRCLFKDNEENFWAGFEGKGLVRIRRSVFSSYGSAEGLSGETVLCMCEGPNGEIWVGTNGDGLKEILPNGQVISYGQNEGLSNPFVWSLNCDRSGTIRAGTWGGGLFRLQNGRFVSETGRSALPPIVRAMHEDRQGLLWVGFQSGQAGAVQFISNGIAIPFELPLNLPRISVHTITETQDGTLWLLIEEAGLFRYRNGRFVLCNPEKGLMPDRITAIEPVANANGLWVAVAGVGLMRWENESFTRLPASRELGEDFIAQITEDGLGFLWCGGNNGVRRLSVDSLLRSASGAANPQWQSFTKSDGLPANECSGAGTRSSDGRVWFLTSAGVAAVNPEHMPLNAAAPPVVIEEILAGAKPLSAGAAGSSPGVLSNAGLSHQSSSPADFSANKPLRIRGGSTPIEIVYTALSFTAPERVKFRHQLVGLDNAPSEAGSARQVRYNYLPPGQYTFEVSACNEHGVWSEQDAAMSFEVSPRFWQTLWFRILAVALIVGATAGTAQWVNSRRMRARMALLEKQRALEVERSRIAQDLHDDLGTSLTEITFLTAMASRPSSSAADIKDNLASISDKSLELVKALDEIVWAVNPKNDSLRNLVNYLCLFAQEFLRPTGIQCRLDVPQGLPDLPLNADQRHTLFLVTKETLANAAKYSGATIVQLHVKYQPQLLVFTLKDNGHGFDRAKIRQDRNGLSNIESRMRQIGGEAGISSGPGDGTQVELKLPLCSADGKVLPNRGMVEKPASL